MTSQTSRSTGWRRTATGMVASGALVAGMLATAPFASSDPEEPADPASPNVVVNPIMPGGADAAAAAQEARTSNDVLLEVAQTYDTGAGGGQVSKLVRSIQKLRSLGFAPSKGNVQAIQAALDKRPNLEPLRAALEETLALQRRNQQRNLAASQSPVTIGINQIPPMNPPPFG